MATTLPKYDVFLSFRGIDTRRTFVSFLYKELVRRNIRTFKDDKDLKSGRRITSGLGHGIEESRFAVVVVSVNYPSSPWCLEELVKIMDFREKGLLTVMPIFYGVDPAHLRRQIGEVAEQFKKHEARQEPERVVLWRQALTSLASISGDCSEKWEDDSKLVDEISDRISRKLMITTNISNGSNKLVGIDQHMKAIYKLLDLNSKESVRVVGIWARGCNGRSALAEVVYQNICKDFQSHCFLESVKKISQDRHISHLREEFRLRIKGEHSSLSRLKDQKILLVANEVNRLEQIDALIDEVACFGQGSRVIITTQDKQLLISSGIKLVYEVEHLRFQKVRELLRQLAFKEKDIYAAFELALHKAKGLASRWLCCAHGNSGYQKLENQMLYS